MASTNPAVDFYFSKNKRWLAELEHLRAVVLDCGLTEELKWGVPCYTIGQKNIGVLQGFKGYCAFLFVKGALLKDEAGLLVQQTANTQVHRQLRFGTVQEVEERACVLKAYFREAIEVEKAGVPVPLKQVADFAVAEEFQQKLASSQP